MKWNYKKAQQGWQTSALAMNAFISSTLSFQSMPVILCLLPSSSIFLYFTYFLQASVNSMCENCECKTVNTVHWFDASCSVIPVNNSITLIPPVLAGLHFFATDRCRQNANPLDAELGPDFNAKWPFKVIRFGVNEEPLRGYIVQYNNTGH